MIALQQLDRTRQLERKAPFAQRIHLDFMDGAFVPRKSIHLGDAWWPEGKTVDLHLMYRYPADSLDEILRMKQKPHMVIVHAEAAGDFLLLDERLHSADIKVGVALLPNTRPDMLRPALRYIDHVLIFSGNLGHFGGVADMSLLAKAQACKHMKPELEIGWDGGVAETNVHLLAAGGVDVLNAGGAIQNAVEPAHAYATLVSRLKG